jgi:hypothetical protein
VSGRCEDDGPGRREGSVPVAAFAVAFGCELDIPALFVSR